MPEDGSHPLVPRKKGHRYFDLRELIHQTLCCLMTRRWPMVPLSSPFSQSIGGWKTFLLRKGPKETLNREVYGEKRTYHDGGNLAGWTGECDIVQDQLLLSSHNSRYGLFLPRQTQRFDIYVNVATNNIHITSWQAGLSDITLYLGCMLNPTRFPKLRRFN